MSQVQRSAWSGVQSAGVVQPTIDLTNLKVCSMSKRRRWARQQMSRSGAPGPDHRSHSVLLARPAGLGRCSTSTRMTLPAMNGASWWLAQRPR